MDLGLKTTELKREKRRSDKLLKQMLPMEVIRQLKRNKQVPAESFECVTIYFSDIGNKSQNSLIFPSTQTKLFLSILELFSLVHESVFDILSDAGLL